MRHVKKACIRHGGKRTWRNSGQEEWRRNMAKSVVELLREAATALEQQPPQQTVADQSVQQTTSTPL